MTDKAKTTDPNDLDWEDPIPETQRALMAAKFEPPHPTPDTVKVNAPIYGLCGVIVGHYSITVPRSEDERLSITFPITLQPSPHGDSAEPQVVVSADIDAIAKRLDEGIPRLSARLDHLLECQDMTIDLASATKRMIDLSTSHMTKGDSQLMLRAEHSQTGLPRIVSHEYGWIVFVSSDASSEYAKAMELFGFSPDFVRIYMAAASVGGDVMLINFDSDAPVVEGLPTFD